MAQLGLLLDQRCQVCYGVLRAVDTIRPLFFSRCSLLIVASSLTFYPLHRYAAIRSRSLRGGGKGFVDIRVLRTRCVSLCFSRHARQQQPLFEVHIVGGEMRGSPQSCVADLDKKTYFYLSYFVSYFHPGSPLGAIRHRTATWGRGVEDAACTYSDPASVPCSGTSAARWIHCPPAIVFRTQVMHAARAG